MAKAKPYKAGEKRILKALARALTVGDIEAKVMKPSFEKETGKAYQTSGGYLEIFLEKDPEAKRAFKTLQREVTKFRKACTDDWGRSNDK